MGGDFGSVDVEQVVHEFLELFDSVRLVAHDDKYPSVGRHFLADVVRSFVEAGRPIGLVLPGFPAKSPNVTKKVLGALPDRGEELALGLLEQFCRDVEKFYPAGAEVVIFSDGRVFADLLAISAETVQAYQKECKRMVADAGYTHIKFDNLENHLAKAESCKPGATNTDQVAVVNKLLEALGIVDVDAHLENDSNLLKLHESLKSMVRLDLEPSKDSLLSEFAGASEEKQDEIFNQKCDQVAKLMILRNMAFSKLVHVAYPGVVRISAHAHNNAGPKFGINLVPGQERSSTSVTPWHNVVVETSDGQIQLMKREMVDLSKFEIYEHPVYKRHWGFKEKNLVTKVMPYHTSVEEIEKLMSSEAGASKILNTTDVKFLASLPVEIKLLQPCGVILHCKDVTPLTPLDIPADTMRRLTMQFGVVVLRGFQKVEGAGDTLMKVAGEIGEIVYWSNFGAVLDVEELPGTTGSVKSSQALAFHWDGAFKFHNSQLQEIDYADIPGFILFNCVKPPVASTTGGETLLVDTRKILRSGKQSKVDLASLEAEYYSPASGYFGGRWVQHKFESPHPTTGEPTLRYLEPWPESRSATQWTSMRPVKGSEADKVTEASQFMQEQIYDEQFCLKHTWMTNDFVFVDNHAVLHARTAFTHGSGRHIRRIHFN